MASSGTGSLSPLTIGLSQISERRFRNYYFPYSVGLLQAYIQRHARSPERYTFLLPLYQPVSVAAGQQALAQADVAGFSCYVWNMKRSLAIAAALKRARPDMLIVLGGPQVPDRSESFLRTHPFVDLCVHGEGEQTFLRILEDWPERNWQAIPGISWLDANGHFQQTAPGPRLQVLDQIPSPYLSGVFDPLMAANPQQGWIATWETNRGCPFSCAFCDWGSLTGSKVYRFDLQRLLAEIEWFGQHRLIDVFTADANFGIFERDLQLARAFAEVRARYGYPLTLQTQTAKNVRTRNQEIQKILVASGLNSVTAISVQSTSPQVLQAIQRENISLAVYQDLQRFCLTHGIYSYTDVIVGLPEETRASFVQTLNDILTHGQHNKIILYNAALLPNAAMAQPDFRRQHQLESILIPLPGHLPAEDGIQELLEIIVATRTYSREDWKWMHVLAWMTNFLVYTHKLLQLPLILMHQEAGFAWRTLLEAFVTPHLLVQTPLLHAIYQALYLTADKFQQGLTGAAENPLLFALEHGAFISPDLAVQMRLVAENKVDTFYQEALWLLNQLLGQHMCELPPDLLPEAMALSRSLFAHFLFENTLKTPVPASYVRPEHLPMHYNLLAFFQAFLRGQPIKLERLPEPLSERVFD